MVATKEYTITKTNVECFKLRHPSGMYWADITLDYEGKSGRIQIASDFGSWQNYWSAAGPDFKTFLTKISIDYAATKFGAGSHFDLEVNTDKLLSEIEHLKKESHIDRKTYNACKKELEYLKNECCNEHHFYSELSRQGNIMNLIDPADWDFKNSIEPGFKRFWNECWPVFINQLKSEILNP